MRGCESDLRLALRAPGRPAVCRPLRTLCALMVVGAALTGCGGAQPELPTMALPAMPKLDVPKLPDMTPPPEPVVQHDQPVGSPTEIYSRVARGANSCWFGGSGPLKKDYIYHAEADAPSRGGKAENTIHKRDPSQPNPRGAKAFKVKIDPVDGKTTLVTENVGMPEPMASGMVSDVGRWAKGDQGCAGSSTVAGWGDAKPAAEAPAAPETKAAKKPVKTAKTQAPKPAAAAKPQAP